MKRKNGAYAQEATPMGGEGYGRGAPAMDTSGADRELLSAASQGLTDAVKTQLDQGANINALDKDKCNRTPLHYTALKGYLETAKLLLHRGANADAKDCDDETALMLAAEYGRTDIVRELLANSADVYAKDKWGKTALAMAEAKGNSDIVGILKKTESGTEVRSPSAAAPAVPSASSEPAPAPAPEPRPARGSTVNDADVAP